MVRANGANTNSEIRTFVRALFSPHPPPQKPTFNASFPAAGGGLGCSLARGPAQGTREPPTAGRRGPRFARLLRPSPHGAACARPWWRPDQAGAHRRLPLGADAGELCRRLSDRRRQGPRARISGADK
jgi:hypothetical protein